MRQKEHAPQYICPVMEIKVEMWSVVLSGGHTPNLTFEI
jgi:hypothetical protein